MPSPFPGIDPFIESQGRWPGFHARFVPALCDAIAARLPDPYIAEIDERMNLVELEVDEVKQFRPDVAITRQGPERKVAETSGATMTLEPVIVTHKLLDEYRELFIEVLHGPDRRLVTVIELLSPSNKTGDGYRDFLVKHNAWMRRNVNLVEFDFLCAGRRLPMKGGFPPGDYFAYISRGDRVPECELYGWSVREPLPTVPIPLLDPDPDLIIELGPIFAGVYERARYVRSINYREPLALPFDAATRAWAENVAQHGVS